MTMPPPFTEDEEQAPLFDAEFGEFGAGRVNVLPGGSPEQERGEVEEGS